MIQKKRLRLYETRNHEKENPERELKKNKEMNRKKELTAVARSMASFSISAMLGMMGSSVGTGGGGELEMGFAAGGAPPVTLFLFLLLFFLLAMFVCFFLSK
jgi:Ca2+/H+ antiporter